MALAFENFATVAMNGFHAIEGALIASAATIAPTNRVHRVSGTAAIVNITLPSADFAGDIVLVPTAIWTWTAAGNILAAGTTTAANIPVTFTYVPSIAKWVASRLA